VKAEELRLEELVRFSKGAMDLHGRRLVIHDLHALGQFRRDVIHMMGREQARRIFTRMGYFWGQAGSAAMKRIFQWENTSEWLKAGSVLQQLQGVGAVEERILEMDETTGRLTLEVTWCDSAEADEYLGEMGVADDVCCWVLVGYASGYASYCLGKSVYFVERKCRGKGDEVCTAIGKDVDSWGEEVATTIPYFQAEDIQGKIRTLTNELRAKELEVARQRRELEVALCGSRIASTEVRSRCFSRVLELAERVAQFDSAVLIVGETGVGKEVLARHIHERSPRSQAPFVAVNCGALPETLLESALFGHKAGAFTGATRDQGGLFEEAQKGTIFFDEIGDTTPAVQLKLLRVLQEHEIMRVGETRPRHVDVRVISATNRDLEQAIATGSFREDLYYRLRVVEIKVPPLRERQDDILSLARQFVAKTARRLGLPELRLDATCIDYLVGHNWPGNIRELENAIEHAAILCRDGNILAEHLPPQIVRRAPHADPSGVPCSLDALEREHMRSVLEFTSGNRTEAAKVLGISLATLHRRLREIRQEKQPEKL
jgi:DNA-binding NtrC family response regulator/predicted hydrocarbon binding protein